MENAQRRFHEKSGHFKGKKANEFVNCNSDPRKRIAVIFGGCSPEYAISLQSAHAIISHMDTNTYVPILIGISKEGDWFLYHGDIEKIPADCWNNANDCTPITVSMNRTSHNLLILINGRFQPLPIDAAFPVLHGRNGEDGTIQGVFELAGIPVVGCGVLSSALCMDKDRAHKLVGAAGICVPVSVVLNRTTAEEDAIKAAKKIGYPLFVKPVRAGSSFGITKVTTSDALPMALKLAFQYDEHVVMEECISGFEVGCAVLGSNSLVVGEVDEIELEDGFFDFTEKYTLKTSAIHVPARIESDVAKQIQQTAKTVYQILDCRGFARVDLFLSESGQIVFNEVNTIPGFTTHSRYPSMMKAAGLSFDRIVSELIEQVVKA